MPSLDEIIRESQIWKSIFRHPAPIDRRNRIVVMLDWVWAYWTFNRYARVITKDI